MFFIQFMHLLYHTENEFTSFFFTFSFFEGIIYFISILRLFLFILTA